MSDSGSQPQEGTFHTWHNSNGDVHLRTDAGILFISKKDTELVEKSKAIPRGSKIRFAGDAEYSNTLSTYVLHLSQLDIAR